MLRAWQRNWKHLKLTKGDYLATENTAVLMYRPMNKFSLRRRKLLGERLEECSCEELHSLEVKLEKSLHCIRGRKVSYFPHVVLCIQYMYDVLTNELKAAYIHMRIWSYVHGRLSCWRSNSIS